MRGIYLVSYDEVYRRDVGYVPMEGGLLPYPHGTPPSPLVPAHGPGGRPLAYPGDTNAPAPWSWGCGGRVRWEWGG